jgi:hypothetical protein
MRIAWGPVLLLLAATATAEDTSHDPAAILTRLRDSSTTEIAWGAYLAGEEKVEAAIPALIRLLRRHTPTAKPRSVPKGAVRWSKVRTLLLDALIRLDAPVPSEVLLPYLERPHRSAALILLLLRPKKNVAILLKQFDREVSGNIGNVGRNIGEVLAAHRAPGVAQRLLARLSARVHVAVGSEDRVTDASMPTGGGGSVGCGFVSVPEGHPPNVSLDFTSGSFASRLDARPRFRRREVPGGTKRRLLCGGGAMSWSSSTIEWARKVIAHMAGLARLEFPERLDVTVAVIEANLSDPPEEKLIAAAVKHRDALHRRYYEILRRLVKRGHLRPEDARALTPPVEVWNEEENTIWIYHDLPPSKVKLDLE